MVERKEWGESRQVIDTPQCQAYRIHVEPFGHCSWHEHARKWNAFALVKGFMTVELLQHTPSGEEYVVTHKLLPGSVYAVEPGVRHRFRVDDRGAEAVEWYWPATLDHDDIIRFSKGGIDARS